MEWFVRQGRALQRDEKISLPFARYHLKTSGDFPLQMSNTLQTSTQNVAPRYPNASVKAHCTLLCDLQPFREEVMRHVQQKKGADGEDYVQPDTETSICRLQIRIGDWWNGNWQRRRKVGLSDGAHRHTARERYHHRSDIR